MSNLGVILNNFYEQNILTYIKMYQEYPIKLVSLVLDIAIVIFFVPTLINLLFNIVNDVWVDAHYEICGLDK